MDDDGLSGSVDAEGTEEVLDSEAEVEVDPAPKDESNAELANQNCKT
jgi:hypothetical protein